MKHFCNFLLISLPIKKKKQENLLYKIYIFYHTQKISKPTTNFSMNFPNLITTHSLSFRKKKEQEEREPRKLMEIDFALAKVSLSLCLETRKDLRFLWYPFHCQKIILFEFFPFAFQFSSSCQYKN